MITFKIMNQGRQLSPRPQHRPPWSQSKKNILIGAVHYHHIIIIDIVNIPPQYQKCVKRCSLPSMIIYSSSLKLIHMTTGKYRQKADSKSEMAATQKLNCCESNLCFLDLKAHPGSIFDGRGFQCIRWRCNTIQLYNHTIPCNTIPCNYMEGGCSKEQKLYIHLSAPTANLKPSQAQQQTSIPSLNLKILLRPKANLKTNRKPKNPQNQV